MKRYLGMVLRRPRSQPLVSLYLWGSPNLHVRIPLQEAQEHLGVAGYHVRATPPVRVLFVLGGGLFFAVTLGYYAFIFFGHDIGRLFAWAGIGLTIGGVPGYIVGALFRRLWVGVVYVAWTQWDGGSGTREVIPMEHLSAAQMMEPASNEHRAATLARIGELPMRRGGHNFAQDGAEAEMVPVVDSAMTANVVATYSPRRLYMMMQGRLWERVMRVRKKGDRLMQAVSLGTIAVSMLVIVALVVLVFTEQGSQRGIAGVVPPIESPNQGVSNAKR